MKALQTVFAAMMAVITTLLISTPALAHPGHDHHANESMLMHVFFYGSIIVALAACAWFAVRHFQKSNKNR